MWVRYDVDQDSRSGLMSFVIVQMCRSPSYPQAFSVIICFNDVLRSILCQCHDPECHDCMPTLECIHRWSTDSQSGICAGGALRPSATSPTPRLLRSKVIAIVRLH